MEEVGIVVNCLKDCCHSIYTTHILLTRVSDETNYEFS